MLQLSNPIPWHSPPPQQQRQSNEEERRDLSTLYNLPRDFLQPSTPSTTSGSSSSNLSLRESLLKTSRQLSSPTSTRRLEENDSTSSTSPTARTRQQSYSIATTGFSRSLLSSSTSTDDVKEEEEEEIPMNELTWSNGNGGGGGGSTKVSWYQNGNLYKVFDYSKELSRNCHQGGGGGGEIVQALFCQFPASHSEGETRRGGEDGGRGVEGKSKGKNREQEEEGEVGMKGKRNRTKTSSSDVSLWGPYRSISSCGGETSNGEKKNDKVEWSDEVLSLPVDPPFPSTSSSSFEPTNKDDNSSINDDKKKKKKDETPLEPYVLIVLSTSLAFLHPLSPQQQQSPPHLTSSSSITTTTTEEGIPLHVPFRIERVWNLPGGQGGIMIERAREGIEALSFSPSSSSHGKTAEERESEDLKRIPIWWSLSGQGGKKQYGELKPIMVEQPIKIQSSESSRTVRAGEIVRIDHEDQGGDREGGKGTGKKMNSIATMKDLNERIVFVSPSSSSSSSEEVKVMVSVNEGGSREELTVWELEEIEGSKDFLRGESDEMKGEKVSKVEQPERKEGEEEEVMNERSISTSPTTSTKKPPPSLRRSTRTSISNTINGGTPTSTISRQPSSHRSQPPRRRISTSTVTTSINRFNPSEQQHTETELLEALTTANHHNTSNNSMSSTSLHLLDHHRDRHHHPDTSTSQPLPHAHTHHHHRNQTPHAASQSQDPYRPSLRRSLSLHQQQQSSSTTSARNPQHLIDPNLPSPEPNSTSTDRRTSLTRNDLSVTMDRMALSQGSSVGGGGSGGHNQSNHFHGLGLGLGGEMDREATMYLGEEEWVEKRFNHHDENGNAYGEYDDDEGQEGGGTMRSEVKWKKIWATPLDRDTTKGIQVNLFDQRSPETATLSILLPSQNALLLLSLNNSSSYSTTYTNYAACSNTSTKCEPIKQIEGYSSTVVKASRSNVEDLLVLKQDGSFRMVTSKAFELDLTEKFGRIGRVGGDEIEMDSDRGKRIVFTNRRSDGSPSTRRELRIIESSIDGMGQDIMKGLAWAMSAEGFERVLKEVVEGRSEGDWEAVKSTVECLFEMDAVTTRSNATEHGEERRSYWDEMNEVDHDSLFTSSRLPPPPSVPISTSSPLQVTPDHMAILSALHLVVETYRLRHTTLPRAQRIAKLVARLAVRLKLKGWLDEYRRTWGPEIVVTGNVSNSRLVRIPIVTPETPPNVIVFLSQLLSTNAGSSETSSPLSIFAQKLYRGEGLSPPYYGTSSFPFSTLSRVLEVYALLSPSPTSTPTSRAHRAMRRFHEFGYDKTTLDDLPFGIGLPLREALRTCQMDPPDADPTGRLDGFFELIGRRELERREVRNAGSRHLSNSKSTTPPADIDSLVRQAERLVTADDDPLPKDKSSLNPIPRAARFNEDKRLEEVARMLQYVDPAVISPGDKTLDQLAPQIQQSILGALSHRTFALPVGAAMFHFASLSRVPTESLEIPKINTSARIIPMASPVALADREPRDPSSAAIPERSEWPDFHSGVAAALRLKFDDDEAIDSSQISFNRPTDLDARHAGLLLGLGLVGKLGSMLSSQAYDYLKAKHDPTSVGILLGLAVSFLGTSDPTVTSVISIHLPALHPPRSSSLNVSGMTKSAAAVALGLVHFGTGRRSFADMFVREMCSVKVTDIEDASACREAYTLSCGFGFGFIMLGRGKDQTTTSNDVDLLRVFRALIVDGNNRPLPGSIESPSTGGGTTDVNITTSAATVGLALMFLRSERQDVANIFEIPDSPRHLDYVRSDLLLLRILARSLVMWTSITPSKEWIESNLPAFISTAAARYQADPSKPMDADLEVARWAIVAGACFAIGFKFAGTATAEAHATLIHYMDRLTRACYVKATTVQSKIKRHALRSSLGVVSIALSMVMAGTGELNVLRRLRVAHGHFSEGITYGYHLSTHMALGLLVLGEAKQTLSNTDGAVATLLLALYPCFPSTSTENRTHLQAYRHLWVLATEARYLEARDVDTDEPVFLPVRLRLADTTDQTNEGELKAKQLVAPTLIPDVRLLDSIQIESPRYWGYVVKFSSNPAQFASFLRDSTLYVKRRTGHLSYAQDPRGIRSIFTRSKSETGSSVCDFGETTRMLNPSASGLRDFVAAFSDDAEAIASTEALCLPADVDRPPTEFEAFCASVLLECLTKDKRDVTTVYHSIYHANALLEPNRPVSTVDRLFAQEQLRLVVDFYKRGTFKSLFGKTSALKTSKLASGSSNREPLLNPAFIDHVSATLSTRLDHLTSHSLDDLSSYLSSTGTWPNSSSSQALLALQVARYSVPSLSILEQLRSFVDSAKEEGVRSSELGIMLQSTAKTIEGTGNKSWSKEVSEILSNI